MFIVNIWITLQIFYLSFQICYTFLGSYKLVDKFEAVIIVLYGIVDIRLDFEHDFTPMMIYNRLINKQGNI